MNHVDEHGSVVGVDVPENVLLRLGRRREYDPIGKGVDGEVTP